MEKKVNQILMLETTTTIQNTEVDTLLATLVLMLGSIAFILLLYLVFESRKFNQL